MTPRNKDENNNKSSDISRAISNGMHLKKQCPFFCFVKPLTPPGRPRRPNSEKRRESCLLKADAKARPNEDHEEEKVWHTYPPNNKSIFYF